MHDKQNRPNFFEQIGILKLPETKLPCGVSETPEPKLRRGVPSDDEVELDASH